MKKKPNIKARGLLQDMDSSRARSPSNAVESPDRSVAGNVGRQERTYTAEEKEMAIALCFRLGTLAGVERNLGIPHSTLHGWLRAKPDAELDEIRRSVRDEVIRGVRGIVYRGMAIMDRHLAELEDTSDIANPEQGAALAIEIMERASRILKNLGDVEQRLTVTGIVGSAQGAVTADARLHQDIQAIMDSTEDAEGGQGERAGASGLVEGGEE